MQEALRDPVRAAAYLSATLEENSDGAFMLAVRRVTDAQGGISRLAVETGLSRQTLYRTLSERGNPRLDRLMLILDGLGFRLHVAALGASQP